MPAVAERPLHKIVPATRFDKTRGAEVEIPGSEMIVGVPGGGPDEKGLVLVRPNGWPMGEPYVEEIGGQAYMRAWRIVTLFKGSLRFPDGVRLGVVEYLTDMGMGQPFVESSHFQIGEDAMERLRCYAYGEPFLSIPERRRIAKATERYMAEHSAGVERADTTTPKEALEQVADARTMAFVEKAVAAALAAERAKTAK